VVVFSGYSGFFTNIKTEILLKVALNTKMQIQKQVLWKQFWK